jgi:hypothetical protein
MKRRNVLPQ